MANSFTDYVGDGGTEVFTIGFPYLSKDHVKVKDNDTGSLLPFIVETSTTVRLAVAPSNGQNIRVYRETSLDTREVDWADGSNITEADLDADSLQAYYRLQEIEEQGVLGPSGPQGPPGADGNTLIYAPGPPWSGIGTDGDSYIDILSYDFYGPKLGDSWPSPVALNSPDIPVGNQSLAPFSNLEIYRATSSRIDLTADAVQLEEASTGAKQTEKILNVSCDIGTSGAGGVQGGSPTGSTWYKLYVIYSPTQGQDMLAVEDSTGISLPGDFTYYGLVGYAYAETISTWRTFVQRGHEVAIPTVTVLSNGSSGGSADVDLADAVPPRAIKAKGKVSCTVGDSDSDTFYIQSSSGSIRRNLHWWKCPRGDAIRSNFELMLETQQTLTYIVTDPAQDEMDIYITGFSY